MSEANLTSDKFSWRRVWLFGSLYRREIRVAMVLYAAVMLVSYLLTIWTWDLSRLGATLVVLSIAGWAVYFAPLMFAFAPVSTAALLPVRPVEKLTFLMLFNLIICPVALQLFWYVPAYLCHWAFDWPTYHYLSKELLTLMSDPYVDLRMSSFMVFANLTQLLAIYAAMTAGIFSARRHPVLRALAGLGIALFILVVESTGWGIYTAMSGHELPSNPKDVNLVLEMIMPVTKLIFATALVLIVACVWWLGRVLKRRQYD